MLLQSLMAKEMMTAEEVADYLSLNIKKIYQLANDGLVPAARVGGKWIFPRSLIEEWIYESARKNLKSFMDTHDRILVAMGSNDFVWEILSQEMIKTPYHLITPYANVGSTEGLVALNNKIAHLASIHLFDPITEEYNIPYLSRYLSGVEVIVVNLFYRNQGLILQKGNPKQITGIPDLTREDISIVNRQEGSGTRILLDYILMKNGISPENINGYTTTVNTHRELAIKIRKGPADTGLGIKAAAQEMDLEFIPLKKERYDVVIPKEFLNSRPIQTLLQIVRSNQFHSLLNRLDGYDLTDTGKLLWEGKVH